MNWMQPRFAGLTINADTATFLGSIHRVATDAFWRTFHHEGKISRLVQSQHPSSVEYSTKNRPNRLYNYSLRKILSWGLFIILKKYFILQKLSIQVPACLFLNGSARTCFIFSIYADNGLHFYLLFTVWQRHKSSKVDSKNQKDSNPPGNNK